MKAQSQPPRNGEIPEARDVEWFQKERMSGGTPELSQVLQVFDADWYAQNTEPLVFSERESKDSLAEKGRAMLQLYVESTNGKKAVAVEQGWELDLADPETGELLDVRLRGVIDHCQQWRGNWTAGTCALLLIPVLWWWLVGRRAAAGIMRGLWTGALAGAAPHLLGMVVIAAWVNGLRSFGHQGEQGLGAIGDAIFYVSALAGAGNRPQAGHGNRRVEEYGNGSGYTTFGYVTCEGDGVLRL